MRIQDFSMSFGVAENVFMVWHSSDRVGGF
jgi:hypothetical protein